MTVEELLTVKADGRVLKETLGNLHLTFDPENEDDMMIYNLLNAKTIAAREARDAANQTN